MAQLSTEGTQQRNPNIVPIGPGGAAGRFFRMLVSICTGGYMYPNAFVEGMDLTAIDQKHRAPYEKKGS